jgi:hypothetical protein
MAGYLGTKPTSSPLTSADLGDNIVTNAKMADDAVGTADIADDAVSLAKMASGTDGNIITYDASGNPVAVATGTAGQILTSAGAGAPPTFATAAGGGGMYESIALLQDVKTGGTGGGAFNTGAWRTRDINTEVYDADGIVTISSNQFTLGAGTYTIVWQAEAWRCGSNQTRLQNITDTTTDGWGPSNTDEAGGSFSGCSAVVVLSGSTVYEIQHRNDTSYGGGFGASAGTGHITQNTYVEVKIYKHS